MSGADRGFSEVDQIIYATTVAALGGLGAVAPPPAISGPHLPFQEIQKNGCMCCYKNTLILANNDILYISMHNNIYLPKGCTHYTPWYYFG